MLMSIKTGAEDGSRYMICAGSVSREVKTDTTAKGTPKAEFGMKYARGEFMNVTSVGDSDVTRMAACLEKGDAVLVAGVWKTRKYTTREGEEKTWSELHAEFVAPQGVMAAVLGLMAGQITPEKAAGQAAQSGNPRGSQWEELDSAEHPELPWNEGGGDAPYDYVPQI